MHTFTELSKSCSNYKKRNFEQKCEHNDNKLCNNNQRSIQCRMNKRTAATDKERRGGRKGEGRKREGERVRKQENSEEK